MKYPSLYLTGNIISADILDKLEAEQLPGQKADHFGFEKGTRLREEIGKAWADANDYWRIYKRKLDAVKEGSRYTTETRNLWLIPLLDLLGYEPEFSAAETINEKSFDISYRDKLKAGFPLLLVSCFDDLDKKPEGNRMRMSPHALLQDYLNLTEHTYGLVSNGRVLRLLRDSGRISKLSYVEFDLERIFEENIFADFALLFRLLHASRMPKSQEEANSSFVEQYHQLSIEEGGRIREALSNAVEKSIKDFANGLLKQNENTELRDALTEGLLSAEEYYQNLLRLVYRLLFIMVVEERKLVFPEKASPQQKRFADIYYQHYSLQRLRHLVAKKQLVQGNKFDLWMLLLQVFAIYEDNDKAKHFGLQALGSDLFSPSAIKWLHKTHLSNKEFLHCFGSLCFFTDKQTGMQHRVNYAALNVEEFGSVYEGLLEYAPHVENYIFSFKKGTERGKSGSHYTPDELVQPLIKYSLDYLLADRKKIIEDAIKTKKLIGNTYKAEREKLVQEHIYTLTVCDVACGSGHILISAARRIAEVAAGIIEEEEQANPAAYRRAKREAIKQCIYGVDKNPMAVELCKVALWLEAHIPGEPLHFLDHHVKCGDAIVGLAHQEELENGIANEAFKTLPGDDKEIASLFAKQNKLERNAKDQINLDLKVEIQQEFNEAYAEYESFNKLPETTVEEIRLKEKGYKKFERKINQMRIPQLADAQVAQFFIPKTQVNKPNLITDAEYRGELKRNASAMAGIQNIKFAYASAIAAEKKFFHWFIQFPEVFKNGGFDCILGNPPYLGGTKISTFNGDSYFNFCKTHYIPASGRCDLVGYFVRRIFELQRLNGFHSIITTNTIAEGDTREGGFDIILKNKGRIVYAEKGVVWPGKANVIVTLYSLFNGLWSKDLLLSKRKVSCITAYLTEDSFVTTPFQLKENEKKAYMGSSVTGDGFLIDKKVCQSLINYDKIYEDVIYKYVNGSDFNNIPSQLSEKRILNFFDSELMVIKNKYPLALEIVEQFVKPEREKKSEEVASAPWWKYWRIREELYTSVSKNKRVLVLTRATSTHGLAFMMNDKLVYSDAVIVFKDDSFSKYSILQSTFHEDWAWRFSSRLKNDRRYSVTDAFETFPFPQNLKGIQEQHLKINGEVYHDHRSQLMLGIQLGLTKTYNLFHCIAIKAHSINEKDKQVIGLRKHLEKTENTIPFEEAIAGILKLRELHVEMDEAVLDAFGWANYTSGEPAIELRHDFYEVDYLPENDRIRYTIHPEARKEVLKRLLELNHKIHDEELKAGLCDKKKPAKVKKYKSGEDGESMVGEDEAQYGLGI